MTNKHKLNFKGTEISIESIEDIDSIADRLESIRYSILNPVQPKDLQYYTKDITRVKMQEFISLLYNCPGKTIEQSLINLFGLDVQRAYKIREVIMNSSQAERVPTDVISEYIRLYFLLYEVDRLVSKETFSISISTTSELKYDFMYGNWESNFDEYLLWDEFMVKISEDIVKNISKLGYTRIHGLNLLLVPNKGIHINTMSTPNGEYTINSLIEITQGSAPLSITGDVKGY